jgi:hypothetical protein
MAIDHRQTMAAFPTICRLRDLFGVGLRELTRTHPERIVVADANPPSRQKARTDD